MRPAYPIVSSLAALVMVPAMISGAAAQATTRCADIQDNAERLACYDRASRSPGGPTPTTRTAPPPAATGPRTASPTPTTRAPLRTPPGASRAGSWQVLSETRPGGGENLFLLTYATGTQPNSDKPALTINCERGKLTAYVRWPREAGARIHKVTYTLDGGQPKIMAMAHSRDTYATGLWHPRGAANFVKLLSGHQQLTVSLTAVDDTPLAAIFKIDGLQQVEGRLRAACRF